MKHLSTDTLAVDAALHVVDTALAQLSTAVRQADKPLAETADHQLRAAVLRAVDLGATWGTVGDHLDLSRGNAYQRYRRRSTAA